MPQQREHIQFVTGRLAAPALRRLLDELSAQASFSFTIDVLPISVAALMSLDWIQQRLPVRPEVNSVVIPGYCQGDLSQLETHLGRPVRRGPRNLHHLPAMFGEEGPIGDRMANWTIEILAEINHAPRQTLPAIVSQSRHLVADGADVIDIGCEPGDPWLGVGDCVKALRDEGIRVSIDSFNPVEVAAAVSRGAELVLSVNSTNRNAALDWGCEVVAIPDDPSEVIGLIETVKYLEKGGVPFRIDPILEPIGLGFAASLERYMFIRREYPERAMMMGVGNLTEMTDADSAAINLLLLGICQELRVDSVLTTQVINWARTSVRECNLARRLVHYAVTHGVAAKHVDPSLVMLRDQELVSFGTEQLDVLAGNIKDFNYRIFAEDGLLHIVNREVNVNGTEPFALFARATTQGTRNPDVPHAFYLGYEMAKAQLALLLGKEYRQDEPLDWGFLTAGDDDIGRQE